MYLYFNTHALWIQTLMSTVFWSIHGIWIDPLTGVYISLNTILWRPVSRYCIVVEQRHGFCLCTCIVYSPSYKSCLADTAAVSATPADTAAEVGPLTSSPPSWGGSPVETGFVLLHRRTAVPCLLFMFMYSVHCTVPVIKAALCIEIN